MIVGLDHIQLALPAGAEGRMRGFYCGLLKFTEIPKPAPLRQRGGFWARAGNLDCHFGVDPNFHPATKAHPAFVVSGLDGLATTLIAAGCTVDWDETLPDVTRFFTADPVGNRIELIAEV